MRSDRIILVLVRGLHTLIYGVMSFATFLVLYIAVSGNMPILLWVILPLLACEVAVFAVSGMKCPLTGVVDRHAGPVHVADTYLPEKMTRHTLSVFGPILLVACIGLAARAAGMIGEGR